MKRSTGEGNDDGYDDGDNNNKVNGFYSVAQHSLVVTCRSCDLPQCALPLLLESALNGRSFPEILLPHFLRPLSVVSFSATTASATSFSLSSSPVIDSARQELWFFFSWRTRIKSGDEVPMCKIPEYEGVFLPPELLLCVDIGGFQVR